jgi:broad specificity phosphatase PhoE
MAELLLVRHAQAAFGTDDYDRLTPLGHQQARWLGEYFLERGMHFDRVATGTLRRHRETVEGIVLGGVTLPESRPDSRLNEYDPERLVAAHMAAARGQREEPTVPPIGDTTPAARRIHFRILRDALTAWTEGQIDPETHRTFRNFQDQAYEAFRLICRQDSGPWERALIVSSGGPISSIVAHHLGAPPSSFVALNLQVRNSGFSEFQCGARGAYLVSFNNVPHLDAVERRQHITFS